MESANVVVDDAGPTHDDSDECDTSPPMLVMTENQIDEEVETESSQTTNEVNEHIKNIQKISSEESKESTLRPLQE